MHRALVALALLLCVGGAQGVVLLDAQHNGYLRQAGASQQALSGAQLHGLVSALTGLQPDVAIDGKASQEIATLLAPSMLRKPRAFLSINIKGVVPEDVLHVFGERNRLDVSLPAEDQGAEDLFTDLAEANPGVRFHLLDELAVQGCDSNDNCAAWALPEVAKLLGGQFSGDSQRLTLGEGHAAVELDLAALTDRVLATELASVVSGLQALLSGSDKQKPQDTVALDLTVVGLRGIAQQYGEATAKFKACKAATISVLQWATDQLDGVFEGDVTVQLNAGDQVAPSTLDDDLAWKEERLVRLLQETVVSSTWPPADEETAAKLFAAKAAGYGGFLLLLYFSLAAAYCLCFMPFKQDTLLFGSKKAD